MKDDDETEREKRAFEEALAIQARVLELVRKHPNSSGNQLHSYAPKIHRFRFFAALEILSRPFGNERAAIVGVRGPHNSILWRSADHGSRQ